MRGGYFYDNYKDTGVPLTTSYTYQTPNFNVPGVPPSLQGPVNTVNTPRIQISNFDKTTQGFFQLDYNHAFTACRLAPPQRRLGRSPLGQRRRRRVPGRVRLPVSGASRSAAPPPARPAPAPTATTTVNDLGTRGAVTRQHPEPLRAGHVEGRVRLTLNLGLRTENEKIPTFRPDIAQYAFQFGFADKLAPRLGATYDVRGDGKVKAFASWGRYYDWTKYEIARGSFGGDLWHIFYRSLDTLDIGSLNLSNMPGSDLWGGATGFRDLRATAILNTDPNIKPMYQDSFNGGVDYQLSGTTALGVHYIHNNLGRTIEDMGALVNGDSVYVIGNPGEGQNTITPASYPATANFPTPKPKRQYDALELTLERRFSKNWFGSANYTLSRLYGNYSGTANSDEISTPTTGVTSNNAQQQVGTIARPGSNSHTGWDIDELLWDSHGNLDPRGRLATDRPHVVKLYGAYQFGMGTQVGAFFYGGSGTPISTQVVGQDQYAPLVERARRHGPHAGPDAHGPARLARDVARGSEAAAVRVEHPEPVQPEDGNAHLQLSEQGRPGRRPDTRGRRDRLLEREPRGGLRLQRADSGDAGRARCLRSAVRDGGSLQPRNAGAVQREVHLLINVGSGDRGSGCSGFGIRETGLGESRSRFPIPDPRSLNPRSLIPDPDP